MKKGNRRIKRSKVRRKKSKGGEWTMKLLNLFKPSTKQKPAVERSEVTVLNGLHCEKGVIIPQSGTKYTILNCQSKGLVSFCGFLDLSALGPGDSVKVSVYMRFDTAFHDTKPVLSASRTYSGKLEFPLIEFPDRQALSPMVTLELTGGVARSIHYLWAWRKLKQLS